MKYIFTILFAALMSFSMNVNAAEEKKEAPSFKKADADGDKSVSKEEYAATGVKRDFAELDENEDGKLSKSEYSALLEEDCG